MNKGVIYSITNKVNGKQYVGLSTEYKKRWTLHRYRLRSNTHNSKYLQHSWNKYGEDNFIFEIVEEVEEGELNNRERYWIDKLNTFIPNGYNLTKGGEGSLGWTPSKETREKISKANSGRIMSEESKEARRKASNELKPLAKITKQQALEVKRVLFYFDGDIVAVSRYFEISKHTVWNIYHEKTWRDIKLFYESEEQKQYYIKLAKEIKEGDKDYRSKQSLKGDDCSWSKYSEETVVNVLEELLKNARSKKYTQVEIAKKYNVTPLFVSELKLGKKWKYISLPYAKKIANIGNIDFKEVS